MATIIVAETHPQLGSFPGSCARKTTNLRALATTSLRHTVHQRPAEAWRTFFIIITARQGAVVCL